MPSSKLRILIITYVPWRDDNNVGNSYSNIFFGLEDRIDFAQIFIRDGNPSNRLCNHYFRISEKGLFKSCFSRKDVGEEFFQKKDSQSKPDSFSPSYNRARRLRWSIFFGARDLIGILGKWKTPSLLSFVEGFKPDLIFGTLSGSPLINNLMVFLHEKFLIPLVVYPWDDYYSPKRVSFSPFYWFRFFFNRHLIRRTVANSSLVYVINKEMKIYYDKKFGTSCQILTKGYRFLEPPPLPSKVSSPLRLFYAGNIGAGRWKTLKDLAAAIEKLNNNGIKAQLFVYTNTPINRRIRRSLNIPGSSYLEKPLPPSQISEAMNAADVLVHVDPKSARERLNCRMSFSTKIVDYFFAEKAILAIGRGTAAIRYLEQNRAAFVISRSKEIDSVLRTIVASPALVRQYALQAYRTGTINHNINSIQAMILGDFGKLKKEERIWR